MTIKPTHKQRICERMIAEPYKFNPELLRQLNNADNPISVMMEVFGFDVPAPSVRRDIKKIKTLYKCYRRS